MTLGVDTLFRFSVIKMYADFYSANKGLHLYLKKILGKFFVCFPSESVFSDLKFEIFKKVKIF